MRGDKFRHLSPNIDSGDSGADQIQIISTNSCYILLIYILFTSSHSRAGTILALCWAVTIRFELT